MNTTYPATIGTTTVRHQSPGPLTEQRLEDRTRRLARRRHRQAQVAAIGLRIIGRPGN
jgi:hypothetical protein